MLVGYWTGLSRQRRIPVPSRLQDVPGRDARVATAQVPKGGVHVEGNRGRVAKGHGRQGQGVDQVRVHHAGGAADKVDRGGQLREDPGDPAVEGVGGAGVVAVERAAGAAEGLQPAGDVQDVHDAGRGAAERVGHDALCVLRREAQLPAGGHDARQERPHSAGAHGARVRVRGVQPLLQQAERGGAAGGAGGARRHLRGVGVRAGVHGGDVRRGADGEPAGGADGDGGERAVDRQVPGAAVRGRVQQQLGVRGDGGEGPLLREHARAPGLQLRHCGVDVARRRARAALGGGKGGAAARPFGAA
ncbi:hypothetical protein FGB62_186g025 [Gracilaria domingensis]|nr:hypothetical protein FGB62_186g025 [Gracilaria domingensis]